MKMNKEQMLKRLAMNIVSQLFDLADVPVEKRQAVNDEADAFVLRLLQQCGKIAVTRGNDPMPNLKEVLRADDIEGKAITE